MSNNEPLISVIIPTYNRAGQCKEAALSALAQTYKNIEVIVVDDSSTDNTPEVMKEISDPRFRYHIKPNEGHPGRTRNLGVKISAGEYIAFLDDDDLWEPQKLEKHIQHILKNPGYGLYYTYYDIFGKGDKRDFQKIPVQYNFSENIFLHLVQKGSFLALPTIMLNKEIFNEIGGFPEIPELLIAEDYDLWMRISKKYKALCLPEVLTHVRFQPNSISEKVSIMPLFTIYERNIRDSGIPEKDKNNFLANAYFISGERSLLKLNNEFRKLFIKSLRLNPMILSRWITFPILLLPASPAKKMYFFAKRIQKKFGL